MKIYVGCSLTFAPEEFKRQVSEIKESLRAEHEVMDFVGLTSGTAKDVYDWDIGNCVANCEAFIAMCDYPSIGLGYELGVALEKLGKPTLALAHENARVSRLLQGIELPHYRFQRYSNSEDMLRHIELFIKENPVLVPSVSF